MKITTFPSAIRLALGLLLSAQAGSSLMADDNFSWNYNFSELGSPYGYYLTTTPSEAGGYFYKLSSKGTWQYWAGATQRSMFGSWTGGGDRSFIARNLYAGGVLKQGQSIANPIFSLDSSWQWGATSGYLVTYMGLFDDQGNGYMATTIVNGTMAFYQVNMDNINDFSSWRLLVANTSAYDKNDLPIVTGGGNNTIKGHMHQIITFSIDDNVLRLTTSVDPDGGLTYTLRDVDPQIAGYTTIVVGGYQANNEKIQLDNFVLTGATIPETSSAALVFGIVFAAIAIAGVRRRARK